MPRSPGLEGGRGRSPPLEPSSDAAGPADGWNAEQLSQARQECAAFGPAGAATFGSQGRPPGGGRTTAAPSRPGGASWASHGRQLCGALGREMMSQQLGGACGPGCERRGGARGASRARARPWGVGDAPLPSRWTLLSSACASSWPGLLRATQQQFFSGMLYVPSSC